MVTRAQRRVFNKLNWRTRPQCTGVTKLGLQCRRGAICDRRTRLPIGPPLCRHHGGREALERYLTAMAAQLAAELVQALDRLPMNKRRS